MAPPHHHDLTTELTYEHHTLLGVFEEMHRTPLERGHREDLLRQAAAAVERHTAAEQRILLPALRRLLPHGDDLAREEAEEHSRIRELLDAMATASPARPGFDARMRALEREMKRHIRRDEHTLFPLLRRSCPSEDLARLGAAFRQDAVRDHPDTP